MQPSQRDGTSIVDSTPPFHATESFADVLDDWMRRSPWLACSLALHAVVAFVLMAIPWEAFDDSRAKTIMTSIEPALEERFEPPPEEVIEDVEELEVEEPVLQDAAVDDVEADVEASTDVPAGDPDLSLEPSPEPFATEPDRHRRRRLRVEVRGSLRLRPQAGRGDDDRGDRAREELAGPPPGR